MSEQGWREFLSAEAVGEWAVLHGGATAVFRVQSLGEAVRIADSIANAPGVAGAGVLLTLADERVTIRLTRDLWALESRHIELARAISAIAREHGAVTDRAAIHAMHIDVSVAREHVEARLKAAVAAGGRIVDDSHAPSHWTLSDQAGNRVCICAWPDGSTEDR